MNYTELQVHILAVCERVDQEQLLPSYIALAEGELTRRLRCRQMVGRATATLDNQYELLPPDFAAVRTFELASSPEKALEYVGPDRLTQLAGLYSTGEPSYYSVIGSEFRFVPTPGTAYPNSQLTYWRTIPSLGGLVTSNWLLAAYPDAYVYGTLKHVDDDRADSWSERFEAIITEINAASAFDDGGPR